MQRNLTFAFLVLTLGLLAGGCGKKGNPDAAGKAPSAEPDSASRITGGTDTSDINKERMHSSIQDLAADKYAGCDAPKFCAGIAYFDCNEKGGGHGLYYDSAKVTLISRCGSFCTHPDDAAQKGMCDTLCPPKAWEDCRKR
ncbi:MAG: hypothetical protein JWP91_2497 [Fibrobacteres bacterium]|nr:hypothetical protein [Fibrobacterota bacterium]